MTKTKVDAYQFRYKRRPSEPPSHFVNVEINDKKRIEVYVSPSGRSIRVYLDGTELTK